MMPLRKKIVSLFAVAVLAFTTLGAGKPSRFERLGHELMCTCGCNQILLECNHVGCPDSDRMRNELSAAIDRGGTGGPDSGVLASFVDKYGPPVLAAPLTTGFGRVAWIMPFAVLSFAVLLCVYLVRLWQHRSSLMPAAPSVADPERAESLRIRARRESGLENQL